MMRIQNEGHEKESETFVEQCAPRRLRIAMGMFTRGL